MSKTEASQEDLELVLGHSTSRLHQALAAVELADRNGTLDELEEFATGGGSG